MRPALILLAVSPLLMAQVAMAQTEPRLPRARCDFGVGLTHLADVERDAAPPPANLAEGRARGERAVTQLRSAARVFLGCGCPRLAELTTEAASVASSAPSEASVARILQIMEQLRFRMQLVREQSERQGCR